MTFVKSGKLWISVREILEKIFGRITHFKSKEELIDDEFERFVLDQKPEDAEHLMAIKRYFSAYAVDGCPLLIS